MTRENPVIPEPGSLFEPIQGPRGLRLALVFGNEAPHGKCPFHESQCSHCDIGAGEGIRFNEQLNAGRLDFFRRHYGLVLNDIEHLIIYNSGSTLNPREFSQGSLEHVLKFVATLPNCRRCSFDSREPFITGERINFLLERVRPDQTVGVTLGLESQDDAVRQEKLGKRMSKRQIETIFESLAEHRNRTVVEMNVVFQPPGTMGRKAVEEAQATIRYGLSLSDRYGVLVDFNYHPYYPSLKGTLEFPEHPRAILQDGLKALILIIRLIKEHSGKSTIFVGWNDESHDLAPAQRQRELLIYAPGLREFNRTQDERDLRI